MTPPKAARSAKFDDTVKTANTLLELSGVPKSFGKLDKIQQAILVFMIFKDMNTVLSAAPELSAKVLIDALNNNSMEYKRLLTFVRKGGDL